MDSARKSLPPRSLTTACSTWSPSRTGVRLATSCGCPSLFVGPARSPARCTHVEDPRAHDPVQNADAVPCRWRGCARFRHADRARPSRRVASAGVRLLSSNRMFRGKSWIPGPVSSWLCSQAWCGHDVAVRTRTASDDLACNPVGVAHDESAHYIGADPARNIDTHADHCFICHSLRWIHPGLRKIRSCATAPSAPKDSTPAPWSSCEPSRLVSHPGPRSSRVEDFLGFAVRRADK